MGTDFSAGKLDFEKSRKKLECIVVSVIYPASFRPLI